MAVCGISQPVYLPWVGYFNLVLKADKFVFLDDVQFSKNTFGNRNRLPTKTGPIWITIPVLKGHLDKTFIECKFDETQNWRDKHVKTLSLMYRKTPSFNEVFPILESKILDLKLDNLALLSSEIILALVEYLGFKKKAFYSSQLDVVGLRSEKILNICRRLECDTYLSAVGAKDYMEEDALLLDHDKSNLKVHFQNIELPAYRQITSPTYISHMSAIDLFFNLGRNETVNYILNADKDTQAVV